MALLLEHNADPNKGSSLVAASKIDDLDIFKILLDRYADPNKGFTLPQVAPSKANYVDIVKLLKEHKANINQVVQT